MPRYMSAVLLPLRTAYLRMERETIERTLAKFEGNISKAAAELGICRGNLQWRIKNHNLNHFLIGLRLEQKANEELIGKRKKTMTLKEEFDHIRYLADLKEKRLEVRRLKKLGVK